MNDGRFYEIERAGCILLGMAVLAVLCILYTLISWLL